VPTIAEKLAEAAVTDTLNRSESPIAGEWKLLKPGLQKGKCQNAAGSEGYTPISTFASGADGCYWGKETFASSGTAVHAYALGEITRIGGELRQTGLWLFRDSGAPETKENGYYLRAERTAGLSTKWTLEKWVEGSPEVLKATETNVYGDGASVAIVQGNGKLYMYGKKEKAGTWEEVMSIASASYTTGYSGLMAKGTGEWVIGNFATGTFSLAEEGKGPERVRHFEEGDLLRMTLGAFPLAAMSMAVIVKLDTATSVNLFGTFNEAGSPGALPYDLYLNSEKQPTIGISSAPFAVPTGVWVFICVTKASGSVKPMFHMYNFSTKVWSHGEGSVNAGNPEGVKRLYFGGGDVVLNEAPKFKGSLAAAAAFPRSLPEKEVESLVSVTRLTKWGEYNPKVLWFFWQAVVTEAVADLVGTSPEAERTGTTVVSEAPPIPYGEVVSSPSRYVKLLVGGVIKEVKRWALVGGQLLSK
jgi:hypothetical protein